jgi:hypothetical protein
MMKIMFSVRSTDFSIGFLFNVYRSEEIKFNQTNLIERTSSNLSKTSLITAWVPVLLNKHGEKV